MLTMHAFHARLFSAPAEAFDLYLRCLAQITRASLDQVAALKSDLAWTDWG